MLTLLVALPAAAADSPALAERLHRAEALETSGSGAEARKIYESLLPEIAAGRPLHARVLRALAHIANQLGDYQYSIQRAGQAAAEYRSLGDAAGEGTALNNLGLAQLYSGAYDAAAAAFSEAVTLSTRAGDRDSEAEELSNLANVYYFQARYLEGLEIYQRALRLTEGSEDWAARRRALVEINMATVYQRLGQDDTAMDLYRRARQTSGVLQRNEEAQLLTNLGVLYRRLGDPFKALDAYQQAGVLFAGDRHYDAELTVHMDRGIVFALDLGDAQAARRSFAAAAALAHAAGNRRDEMQATLYSAETLYRQGLYREASAGFQNARDEAAAMGTAEEEWKALYGLGRVAIRAGDDARAAELLRQAVGKIESLREKLRLVRLKSDFFADKRAVYDALISLRLKHADAAEIFSYMERSRERTLQDRLHLSPSPDLAALRASLDEHTAVLEFWFSPRGAAVLSASREGVRLYPLALDDARIPLLNPALAGEGEWRAAAGQFARDVLPAGAIPAGTRDLVIVPDGSLASIPFDILPYGERLVVEQFATSYLPAASLLERRIDRPKERLWPWATGFIGLGNPLFSSEPLPGPVPGALPGSAAEVESIAKMLPGRARLFLGAGDRKEVLFEPLTARSPVLHLATHATSDPENPERSRILFSSAAQGGGAADYLFLKAVYSLDLRQVDLVTLSACATESGKLVQGEGVQGFSRAFLAAGAHTVVATMWRVADGPTAEFMKLFYAALGRGESKARALQNAKLHFLRAPARSHPRYWAAFMLSGQAGAPIPMAVSWWWLIAPAAALLVIAALAVRRVSSRRFP